MTVVARHKKPLTEAQIAQRRAAGRVRRPQLSAAELQQRQTASLAARDHSTGPITEEGKTASSRNAWKHGQYSAATKRTFAMVGGSLSVMFGKSCKTTCPVHPDNPNRTEAPCSLVERGLTRAGADCLDKQVYVEAFDAIMASLQDGEMDGMNGVLAANLSANLQLLQRMREEISTKGLVFFTPLQDADGQVVYDKHGEPAVAKVHQNPTVMMLIRMSESLQLNLPELLATPLARSKLKDAEEDRSTMATLLGAVMLKAPANRRLPQTIEHQDG